MTEHNPVQWLELVLVALPVIFAVTVHEVAHGWAAFHLGDDTAYRMGRLTLNPLRHLDPIGSVLLPLGLKLLGVPFLFGWARPVPVDWRRLRHLRRDIALVAIAGPAANLLMLLGWAALLRLVPGAPLWREMCWTGVIFNATIMTLNLIPIPPLDGSRLVTAVLPARAAIAYNRLERYGLILVALLVASGAFEALLTPIMRGVGKLLALIAG